MTSIHLRKGRMLLRIVHKGCPTHCSHAGKNAMHADHLTESHFSPPLSDIVLYGIRHLRSLTACSHKVNMKFVFLKYPCCSKCQHTGQIDCPGSACHLVRDHPRPVLAPTGIHHNEDLAVSAYKTQRDNAG